MPEKPRASGGFTLLEILAVLVILGIIAVIAVPKYVDMQQQAADKAALGAVAAAQDSVGMTYARLVMENNGVEPLPTEIVTALGAQCGVESAGDFNISCSGDNNATVVNIHVKGPGGGTADGQWSPPD